MLSALTSSLPYWCSFLTSFIRYHGLKYHTFTNYYKCVSHTVFFLLEFHTFRVWEVYETYYKFLKRFLLLATPKSYYHFVVRLPGMMFLICGLKFLYIETQGNFQQKTLAKA